jgi:hypothetical protein
VSASRLALAVLALAALLVAVRTAPAREPRAPRLVLLAPFAGLAAELQWLRFHAAVRAGEEARALELAESALTWEPSAPAGWQTLAAHLVFDRASREREPDLARRRAWLEAGLAELARGVERCARPGELELLCGITLASKAALDPELDPGGAPALRAAARAAFERAAALGEPRAAAFLAQARAAEADPAE